MNKLKVGDNVTVNDDADLSTSGRKFQGRNAKVVKLGKNETSNGPHVTLDIEDELKQAGGVYESELTLIEENKMNKVTYHLLGDSVIVNVTGKGPTSIKKGDVRFEQVVTCIRENRLQDIPEILDSEAAFAKKGLVLKDGLLYMGTDALPDSLSKRVLGLLEANMPIDIMVKFWENLKANPSFNSRKMLYAFLEHNGHPLTEDGCFIAYRGVTDDFKDVHTKMFDNSVGQTAEVRRDQVDDNPNNTCSNGLHVACYDYAKGFGPQLIEVKVNPKDVVAVPVDYNGTKMRVCKFEVVAVGEKMRTEPVYQESSPETDEVIDNVEENYEENETDEEDYYSSDYYTSDGESND